jgi:hypothetical protein
VKRRKKLWIACAALAVVVTLCALALCYRPGEYEFLRDSKMVQARTWFASSTMPLTRRVTYCYRMDGPYEEVLTAAKRDLIVEERWGSIDVGEQGAVFVLKADERSVVIFKPQPGFERVQVTVTSDATLFDRMIVWMNGGER